MHDAVVVGAGLSGLDGRPPACGRRRRRRRARGGEPGRRPRLDAGRPRRPLGGGRRGRRSRQHPPARRSPRRSARGCGGRRSAGATTARCRSSGTWRGETARPTRRGIAACSPSSSGRGAEPRGRRPVHRRRVDGARRRRDVRPRRLRDGRLGDVLDDAGQAHVAPRAGRQDAPPGAAPATAPSCASPTARAGSPRGSRLGSAIASGSGPRPRRCGRGAEAVVVECRRRAASARGARSSPCRCTPAPGSPACRPSPDRPLRRRRQVADRAGRRPAGRARRPSSPTPRSATPTGATRAAWGASSGRRRPRGCWRRRAGAATRAVAEAVRRCFGVRVSRIMRVAYPRSYLIFAPGELRGFGASLADPAGPVHFAGAETSELPSFMEGAVRAGERAAAEVSAAG